MGDVDGPAPGQHYVPDFIPYDALGAEKTDISKWSLSVTGLVSNPLSLRMDELKKRKIISYTHDFDCVTRWSVKDVKWKGVSLKSLIEESKPRKEADWVMLKCSDGYTTPVPIGDVMSDNAIIALEINGKALTFEQGGPARPFFPSLYGWKSAKWLNEIELIAGYKDGYWEKYGYHKHGRVEEEERFQSYEWKNLKKHVLRMVKP